MSRASLRFLSVVLLMVLLMAAAPGCNAPDGDGQPAEAPHNTLNWQAGTEEGVFGYLIYRSDRREGPFRRINPNIVRVPSDRRVQHDYSWIDDNVVSGTTYYYYLDAVSLSGIKQRFSGIIDRTTP